MSKNKFSAKVLVNTSLLTALSIILRLLGFPQSGIFRIELGFAPIAVCGAMYGTFAAGTSYIVADIIGTVATGMTPFFPITICKFFIGAFFGLFFFEKGRLNKLLGGKSLKNIILCNVCIGIFVDLLLMPLALLPISGDKTLWGIVCVRAAALLFNVPLRCFTLWLTFKYILPKKLKTKN